MTCYAYFVEGQGTETLSQHIRLALSELETKFLSRRYHVRVARLVRADAEVARNLLKLVVLLHDVGKGTEEYQSRKRGFRGHEYLSALIAYRSVKLRRDLISHLALAIYLHHHTMVGRSPPKGRHALAGECVQELVRLAAEEGLIDLIEVEDMRKGFNCRDSMRLIEKLKAGVRANPLPSLALLYPLIVVDNLAAFRGRGGEGGVLLKEIASSYGPRDPT